ncbi:MAG: TIGR03087 family PEP-CTERM/XrtA system glycosyltransferase [Phycisphaerae bacterium]|nr:TIGR03087 family PEP-CTERM/XrtA system glycosyltransferase [Phycisphaerae bacterium]NUQ48179.1 TIGR03087 family PEP-CTERM/XrtA system glycosyltransferase [Phycisphaerae bacterium]
MSRRILFLAHRIPWPPDKGDKLRSFHWLDRLARRHHVRLACFVDDPADMRHVPALRALCADVLAIPLDRATKLRRAAASLMRGRSGGSITAAVYHDAELWQAIEEWRAAAPFDAVFTFSSAMAPYAMATPAPRHVIDVCDCDSRKWLDYAERSGRPMSAVYRREARLLRALEHECLRRFDAVCVVNKREAQQLFPMHATPSSSHSRGPTPTTNLNIIPNGVDCAPITPLPAEPRVGFVGALDYRPNVDGLKWFVSEVWPRVRRDRPDAEFHIIGRTPVRAVRRLSGAAGVRLIGPVDDLSPRYRRLRICVAPLHIARGVQNKVLEAMAHGRPVVATSCVADGLDARAGEHLLVADNAADFARAALQVLQSPDAKAKTLADTARTWVRQEHLWSASCEALEQLVCGELHPMPPSEDSRAFERVPAKAREEIPA